MVSYEDLQGLIIEGQEDKVKGIVNSLLDSGADPMEIISDGLVSAMNVVGVKFKSGEMFIPEVLASAHAMKEGTDILKPLIVRDAASSLFIGKVVIGTVEGDIHSIGKAIVSMLLESTGFEVVNLGENVPTKRFIEVVEQEQPNILGLSALLTPTMPVMKKVIEALKSNGLRDKVKVMVGGAPLTQSFADSIGADGYAYDAGSAVDKAKQLVGRYEML